MTHLLLALVWSKFGTFVVGVIFGATGGYKVAARIAKSKVTEALNNLTLAATVRSYSSEIVKDLAAEFDSILKKL
jgi:hypothetical protein